MRRPIRKLLRAVFNTDPDFYDMYGDEPTRAAGEEYLRTIKLYLERQFGQSKLDILDAGCQAGRLLIPLAQAGHHMIGIDTSGFSLRRTRRHAKASGLSPTLYRTGISNIRRRIPPSSLDAVISTEVLYLCRDHKRLLDLLAESVKPGGLLFISHRPRIYYIARALEKKRVDLAVEITQRSDGISPEGQYHNWQTPEELSDIYLEHRLKVLECLAVQHTQVAIDPSTRMESEIKQMLDPLHTGDSAFWIPTYLLVIARRPK